MGDFEANAERLRQLHDHLRKCAAGRNASEAANRKWQEAAREFHSRYDELALPGGLIRNYELFKAGDQNARDELIRFLEADPLFFRSGYLKEGMIQ
jgi:hypothetical protein